MSLSSALPSCSWTLGGRHPWAERVGQSLRARREGKWSVGDGQMWNWMRRWSSLLDAGWGVGGGQHRKGVVRDGEADGGLGGPPPSLIAAVSAFGAELCWSFHMKNPNMWIWHHEITLAFVLWVFFPVYFSYSKYNHVTCTSTFIHNINRFKSVLNLLWTGLLVRIWSFL